MRLSRPARTASSGLRTTSPASDPRRGAGTGYTLIEILLVLAIIGVLTAVTLPNLVRSMRGNRLRFAARTVVMAGRYARSMAVLKQADMVLRFDLDRDSLSVTPQYGRPAVDAQTGTGEEDPPDLADAEWDGFEDRGTNRLTDAEAERIEVERSLDRVRIRAVESADPKIGIRESGAVEIVYRSNGTCTPYEIWIEDEHEQGVRIEVDALSSAETERES